MVFQKPTPFPKTIFENVAYGLRVNGELRRIAHRRPRWRKASAAPPSLRGEGSPDTSALGSPAARQQRLCIARALAVEPEVLLMDEPASALDPIATQRIEEGIHELKSQLSIVIVTHSMQQAARVSDRTAFFYMGKLIECDLTEKIFTNPSLKQTEDYITGRFG